MQKEDREKRATERRTVKKKREERSRRCRQDDEMGQLRDANSNGLEEQARLREKVARHIYIYTQHTRRVFPSQTKSPLRED